MEIVITGRQMRITVALKKYIEERVQRTEKYLSGPAHITFILKEEKYRQIAEAHLTVDGFILTSVAETEEMQASVDQVMMKIERQLKKHKEKVANHRVRPASAKGLPAIKGIPPRKGKSETGRLSLPSPIKKGQGENLLGIGRRPGAVPPLIDHETIFMEVLTLNAALVHMKSKKDGFFFFRNRDDQQHYLLHKKNDGRFGLIELRDDTAK